MTNILQEQQRFDKYCIRCGAENRLNGNVFECPICKPISSSNTDILKKVIADINQWAEERYPDSCDCVGAKYECEHWGRSETLSELQLFIKSYCEGEIKGDKTNYNHISHTHCWDNIIHTDGTGPCGIPLEKQRM